MCSHKVVYCFILKKLSSDLHHVRTWNTIISIFFGYKSQKVMSYEPFTSDISVTKYTSGDEDFCYFVIDRRLSCKIDSNQTIDTQLIILFLQPQCFATCVQSYPPSCPWINTSTGYASIPLCFKQGWPVGCAPVACYQPGWQGSWNNPNVPCLPPIIGGKPIPPCSGLFVIVQQKHIQNACY